MNNKPIEAESYTVDQFISKIAEKFQNETKFLEHNKLQKIEAETSNIINSIQEFLDSHYNNENTHYLLLTKEPKVIAKVIIHFQKFGWRVERCIKDNNIKLDFFPGT